MGHNMRERLRRAGHTVVGYDRNPEVSDAASLEEMAGRLLNPRVVWVMLPIQVVDGVIDQLADSARAGRPGDRRRKHQVDRRRSDTLNSWPTRAFSSSTAECPAGSGACRMDTR